MITLADVFDPAQLTAAIDGGYVRVQRHPEHGLRIYNYTEKSQFEGAWSPVTLACRGLITTTDGTIVARPLPKFFNYGQSGAPSVPLDGAVQVTDKADGSLGIIYPVPGGGYAVATRGSFASDQAVHATELLRERYATFTPPPGLTVLVEIIYPGNRIVIDYGGMDDLMLLGAVDIRTGRSYGPDAVPGWPGQVVTRFPHTTLADALAAPARDNREGLVVWFPDADVRVKVKYDEYIRLHRLITGLTTRTVWEAMVAGIPLSTITEPLPDEFHVWVANVAAELTATVEARVAEVEAAYGEIVAELTARLGGNWTRRDFAALAQASPERAVLFLRLDGKDYRRKLWEHARPEA